MSDLKAAAAKKGMTVLAGKGDEDDTLRARSIYVYDTSEFPFHAGELYHQYHNDMVCVPLWRARGKGGGCGGEEEEGIFYRCNDVCGRNCVQTYMLRAAGLQRSMTRYETAGGELRQEVQRSSHCQGRARVCAFLPRKICLASRSAVHAPGQYLSTLAREMTLVPCLPLNDRRDG